MTRLLLKRSNYSFPLNSPCRDGETEYYGNCGIDAELSQDARDVMEAGELAVWPAGNALCIFFGPTPVSKGNEPRAISPVNPVGKLIGNPGF